MTRDEAIAATTGAGQPYELVDAVIGGRALRVFKQAPASLRAMFEQTASELPFLAYEDERWTFAQAWQAAARIGHVLVHDCGVRHGERVAIAMRNYPEWVLAFTAITAIGAVAVGMNAHWQADELAFALADGDVRVVFADAERLQRLAECDLPGLQVLAVRADPSIAGARSLAALTAAAGRGADAARRDRPRRPGDHDVHLGLHRPPEGRAVHAAPGAQRRCCPGRPTGASASWWPASSPCRPPCSRARCWRCRCSMSRRCMPPIWSATACSGAWCACTAGMPKPPPR